MMANHPADRASTYEYNKPLAPNNTRLLRISEIYGKRVGELVPIDLVSEQKPPYFALSYTWASASRDRVLPVNGAKLKITQSVEVLLPYIYRKYRSQYLWIDGICIDQDDPEERAEQVKLMRMIYSKAASCIIWLGKSSVEIDRAIRWIPDLAAKFQGYDSSLGFTRDSLLERGIPDMTKNSIWTGIWELLGREWFNRVWTFQEAVLPPALELRCGDHLIDTSCLALLASGILSASESGSLQSMITAVDFDKRRARTGMERVLAIARARNRPSRQAPNFLNLLLESWDWQFTKDLDKIYGLLRLADEDFEANLEVNYVERYTRG
jgi:hypothetical protein